MVLRLVFTRGALASCLCSLLLWVDEQSWSRWPQIQAGSVPTHTGWGVVCAPLSHSVFFGDCQDLSRLCCRCAVSVGWTGQPRRSLEHSDQPVSVTWSLSLHRSWPFTGYLLLRVQRAVVFLRFSYFHLTFILSALRCARARVCP